MGFADNSDHARFLKRVQVKAALFDGTILSMVTFADHGQRFSYDSEPTNPELMKLYIMDSDGVGVTIVHAGMVVVEWVDGRFSAMTVAEADSLMTH